MFTERLTAQLGLINWRSNGTSYQQPIITESPEINQAEPLAATAENVVESPELNKAEFRLLVNMLKAINHDCQYENLLFQGDHWTYQLADTQLIFDHLEHKDNPKQLHLCTLSELINQPELKRPVWEKLKTLMT